MTHEAGIEAAFDRMEEVSDYPDFDIVDVPSVIQAYLSASGMVLVPKDPNHDMRLAALTSPLPSIQDNRPLYEICWGRMLAAAPDPFKSKP